MLNRRVFMLVAVTLLGAGSARADVDANYADLGTLGGDYSAAIAINDSGQVVGVAETPEELGEEPRAFLYDNGAMLNLGTLGDDGSDESYAIDINESGLVLGNSDGPMFSTRAFFYSGGVMTSLGTLGGTNSEAFDLNDAGQAVGYSDVMGGADHAFLYSGGVMNDLGTLGGTYSYAVAVNNAGQVAGYADTLTQRRAFLYTGGMMLDLGTLGGTRSLGFGINELGDVTGNSLTPGDASEHAFLYDASSATMMDLGTLGGTYALGFFVNSAGQVAGDSLNAGNTEYHAFLYTGGTMLDLSGPGRDFAQVHDLGEDGGVLFSDVDPDTFERRAWYYRNGVKKEVGTLGLFGTEIYDMNSHGVIAGATWPLLPAEGRHAFVTSCPLLPSSTCTDGTRSSIRIKDDADDERDQVKWKWGGSGDEVLQADLGSPDTSTNYALCVYDSTAGAASLVSVLRAEAGDDWTDKDPKGWSYSDNEREQHGISRIQVKPGAAGKAKARVSAKGVEIPMPAAISMTEMLDVDPHVTTQMHVSNGTCMSGTLTDVKRNSPAELNARTP